MPVKTTNFLPFSHPLELLSYYDEDILEGRIKLYDWQQDISQEFSKIPEKGECNEIDVVTNNGSGKSKMLISPALVWVVAQFDKAESILTSASGTQVDNQTGRYIKDLAQKMNTYHKKDLWTIQYRKLHFSPTDGYLDIFATDEGTKAEGWHPREYDTAFCKGADEAKAISDEIFEALDRCLDAQWNLRVSSPRIGTQGYFYKKVVSGLTKLFRITAYQCPHISKSAIDKIIAQYGLHSPITRSIIFAEFTSIDESVVITRDALLKLIACNPLACTKDQPKRVGCDIAAGGDENVISIFDGNKQILLRPFREADTVRTKNLIVEILGNHGIPKSSEYLFFDDGHVGHAVIDMLWADGWNVKRVINQSKSLRMPDMYANRGAELYFSFANFVNNQEIILINDSTLIDQLSSRYYKQQKMGSKIVLESKYEARANGHGSPDRADATVLSLSDIQSPYFINLGEQKPQVEKRGTITQAELVEFMDQLKYSRAFQNTTNNNFHGSLFGNIGAFLNNSGNQRGERIKELLESINQNNEN